MNEFPGQPKSNFSCPLSPYVMWHKGLIYKECPVHSHERMMGSCENCPLRGEKSTKPRQEKPRRKETKKEEIPTINKTYISK